MERLQQKLALPVIKLDIGSGDHHLKQPKEEWIHQDGCPGENVDIVCDFSAIPLDSGIVDEAWSGDSIEHIPLWDLDKTMKEWNRVMKVGGVLGGQTPNLHSVMMRYAANVLLQKGCKITNPDGTPYETGDMSLRDATLNLYGWHDSPWQQHYVTYTVETITELLEQYGFGEVTFPQTPGATPENPQMSWWLCFSCKKLRDI